MTVVKLIKDDYVFLEDKKMLLLAPMTPVVVDETYKAARYTLGFNTERREYVTNIIFKNGLKNGKIARKNMNITTKTLLETINTLTEKIDSPQTSADNKIFLKAIKNKTVFLAGEYQQFLAKKIDEEYLIYETDDVTRILDESAKTRDQLTYSINATYLNYTHPFLCLTLVTQSWVSRKFFDMNIAEKYVHGTPDPDDNAVIVQSDDHSIISIEVDDHGGKKINVMFSINLQASDMENLLAHLNELDGFFNTLNLYPCFTEELTNDLSIAWITFVNDLYFEEKI